MHERDTHFWVVSDEPPGGTGASARRDEQ